jgi:zearalenone synthase (highly reducing iterative type I polyketide synthase)
MAELLVEHGARNLVFLSRPGPKCAEEQPPNGKPRSRGVAVREYICNISDEAALRKVLDQCSKDMPPIRGVVQITGDLHDPSDGKMTYDLWQQCLYPGMLGSWLLHKWLPQDMDFFVMLDSTSRCTSKPPSRNCTRGNIFQEALARQRRGQGLHAVAVVVQQAGPHMRPIDQADSLATPGERGMAGLSEPQFRAIMKAAMLGTYGQGNAMPAQLVVSVVSGDGPHHEQNGPSTASNGPRLESLTKTHRGQSVNWWASEDLGKNDLEARLRQCKTLPEASKMIEETICEFLARRLTMTASDMDTHRPLSSYGVDSQMAAEMRALVKQRVQADIGLFEFLAGGHISALAVKIAESSQVVHPGVQSMYARAELT